MHFIYTKYIPSFGSILSRKMHTQFWNRTVRKTQSVKGLTEGIRSSDLKQFMSAPYRLYCIVAVVVVFIVVVVITITIISIIIIIIIIIIVVVVVVVVVVYLFVCLFVCLPTH